MASETVRVDWTGGQQFLLKDHFDFPILMTQPEGVNGADLLPLSVIGCALWDVASILLKQRQPVTAMQASADSLREDGPPWRFRKIHIRYRFTGRGLSEAKVRRAIELAETRYCSTLATLRQAVEIDSEWEIVDEAAAKGEDEDGTR